jgi:hypothetical protein
MERRLSLPAREDIVAGPSLVGRPREIVDLIFYWSFPAPNEFLGDFWGRFCIVHEPIKQYNKTTTAFLAL